MPSIASEMYSSWGLERQWALVFITRLSTRLVQNLWILHLLHGSMTAAGLKLRLKLQVSNVLRSWEINARIISRPRSHLTSRKSCTSSLLCILSSLSPQGFNPLFAVNWFLAGLLVAASLLVMERALMLKPYLLLLMLPLSFIYDCFMLFKPFILVSKRGATSLFWCYSISRHVILRNRLLVFGPMLDLKLSTFLVQWSEQIIASKSILASDTNLCFTRA